MADIIQEQKELYKNHLEFLGYRVEYDTDDDQEMTVMRDNRRIFMRVFDNGLRTFCVYKTSAKAQSERLAFLEFINSSNHKRIAKMYIGNDWATVEMWHLNTYQKVSFGTFMSTLQDEVSAFTKEFSEAGFWA